MPSGSYMYVNKAFNDYDAYLNPQLTLCFWMDFSIHIDTINMGLPIV